MRSGDHRNVPPPGTYPAPLTHRAGSFQSECPRRTGCCGCSGIECRDARGSRLRGAAGELPADLRREHEADVLVDGRQLGDVGGAALAEELDEPLDELLGRAGAGGDPDRLDALEPGLVDLEVVVDQVRGGAVLARDLDQAVRVRGVRRADHQHQLALAGELLDGLLAVGGRVTDVVGLRTGHVGELPLQRAR